MTATLALAMPAAAQTTSNQAASNQTTSNQAKDKTPPREKALQGMTVQAAPDAGADYKVDILSSTKRTEALLDTPQTVVVVKRALIEQQGAFSLTDALRNTPGITLQQGEKDSNAAGDTFTTRGFSAQSSIFLDGIRDLGAITRDTFNIEQIEIAKGPSGADNGRGAQSGYINLVSKQARLKAMTSATASINTVGGQRLSADVDAPLGGTAAIRINAMEQNSAQEGRSRLVKNRGQGVAAAFAVGLGTGTRAYLFGQYVWQDNVPYAGIPTIGLPGFYNANPLLNSGARVNPRNFYGTKDDRDNARAAMVTARFEHDLAGGFFLNSTFRYGRTTLDRVMTSIYTAYAAPSADPATWTTQIQRQRIDQRNRIAANQTNLTGSVETGPFTHDLSVGVELMYEQQYNGEFERPFSGTKTLAGTVIPSVSLYAPNPSIALPVPASTGGYTDGNTRTASVYGFDTVKLGTHWLLTLGGRLDRYHTETTSIAATKGTPVRADLAKTGTLKSWNTGLVYKPVPNGSLYLSYATAQTPPGSASFALETPNKGANNAQLDPQTVTNVEGGVKWDLLGGALALTGAYYHTISKNELAQLDPASNVYVQFGKRTVSGIELTAVGRLTRSWQITAGLQTLNAKIKQGAATGDLAAGAATRWSPKLSATLWTTYAVTPRLTLGGGARYVGDQLREVNQSIDLAKSVVPKIPAYAVADGFLSYQLTKQVALNLNGYNLFNKDYIATLSANSLRATLGQRRSAMLTAHVAF